MLASLLEVWVIILMLVMIPAVLQFLWLCIFKSRILKLLPAIIVVPSWIICVLGSY